LWSWDTFASGRVQEFAAGFYIDPDRPWWRRSLNLRLSRREDRYRLRALIKLVLLPPTAPEPPEELMLQYAVTLKDVRLHSGGIAIQCQNRTNDPRQDAVYTWNDVTKLLVTREVHDFRGFSLLQLVVPDRAIQVTGHTIARKEKSGPKLSRETLLCFLTKHVPANRILYIAKEGTPLCREECVERLSRMDKDIRDNRRYHWFVLLLLGIATILAFAFGKWGEVLATILTGSLLLLLHLPVYVSRARELRRQRTELTMWLETECGFVSAPG
jgi:hypothetical protein